MPFVIGHKRHAGELVEELSQQTHQRNDDKRDLGTRMGLQDLVLEGHVEHRNSTAEPGDCEPEGFLQSKEISVRGTQRLL
jgi:hypothetical protein